MEARAPHAGVERAAVTITASSAAASRAVAREIAELIRAKASKGERAVLGLATGSTPQGVYEELVRLHKEEGLSFKNVTTFNLDEYYPMPPGALQSYRRFMREHLFEHVDLDPKSVHLPDGTIERSAVSAHCEAYERMIREAGGIDLQILGIGRTGHVGFNEPGSPRASRTRLITLDAATRADAASDFFGERHVPRTAITMGVGTILEARRLVLIAFGEHKAHVVKRAVEGEITSTIAASYLQEHPGARFVLDPAAAAELTRVKTPWLLGALAESGLEWDDAVAKRAVIWLAQSLRKPILKLTEEDYNEHGLQELLTARGRAYDLNIAIFNALRHTITGWPGGKPGRPRFVPGKGVDEHGAPDTFPKRILVFSPHPDDDVISMGGTLIRLCDQGHEVHVAYQTSGNIAVFDESALRHMDFVVELVEALKLGEGLGRVRSLAEDLRAFAATKHAGEIDTPALQTIKGLIRRSEARAGARYSGVRPEHTHFLDLPFYETGAVRKKPLGTEDVRLTVELLRRIRPHQVYAAGDLSDPHGTHRVCLKAIVQAMREVASDDWARACEVWLYRGAWQEWSPHEIEMAVPLSPSEVERKRMAIFKPESQKDRALFPGVDSREFWQRAEDRNRHTAQLYDALGLPEYQAIEGFVSWKVSPVDPGVIETPGKKPLEETKATHSRR